MKTGREKAGRKKRDFPAGSIRTAAVFLTALLVATLHAALPNQPGRNLGDLSLEELMNETVTSVSKKEQKLGDAASAVSVLSNDALRRSGATTLADALRLVPGMDVASINAGQTAVSARGFNNVYANKLLVLVDGRAVYTPLFGGVHWDLQQTMMEDVDRIEVIRGPGATLWGANAVNGVINVVTRSARETPGGLIYGGGDGRDAMGGLRYGGQPGERTYYRVYGGGEHHDDHPLAGGQEAGDQRSSRHGGVRVDHYRDDATHLTWLANATATDIDHRASHASNVNTLARWARTGYVRSSLEAQIYYDRTHRHETLRADTTVDTLDFSLQHGFTIGGRQDVNWGIGYRFIEGAVAPINPAILVHRGDFSQHLSSAFLQDEIKLVPDKFTLTLGTKIEHNDYTGFEIQPNLWMVFKPAHHQTLWAAISRAVRTPTVVEGRDVIAPVYGAPLVGPGGRIYLPTLTGNPDLSSETLWACELGWRVQPHPRVLVDVAVFHNNYRDLIAPGSIARLVPGGPVGTAEIPWTNSLSGRTSGGEGSVTVTPMAAWRLTAAYSLLNAQIQGAGPAAEAFEKGSPRHQISARSSYDFNPRLSLDGRLSFVDSIPGVPAYHTADLRLSYRPNERCEFSLVGRNLLDPQHPEQTVAPFTVTAEVPRSFHARFLWRF